MPNIDILSAMTYNHLLLRKEQKKLNCKKCREIKTNIQGCGYYDQYKHVSSGCNKFKYSVVFWLNEERRIWCTNNCNKRFGSVNYFGDSYVMFQSKKDKKRFLKQFDV